MTLTKSDIEQIAAYESRTMPKGAKVDDWIYYYCISALFHDFKTQKITKQEAIQRKSDIIAYLDIISELARSNSKIITELAKATAPRAELTRKSKAQLLDVISRIEGVVTGLMNEYGGKVPEFLKMED